MLNTAERGTKLTHLARSSLCYLLMSCGIWKDSTTGLTSSLSQFPLFSLNSRFNLPEQSKHRRAETANLCAADLRRYSNQLFQKLEQPWLKKHAWKDVADAIHQLACSVHDYASLLLKKNKKKLLQIMRSSFQFMLIQIGRSWWFIRLCSKCYQSLLFDTSSCQWSWVLVPSMSQSFSMTCSLQTPQNDTSTWLIYLLQYRIVLFVSHTHLVTTRGTSTCLENFWWCITRWTAQWKWSCHNWNTNIYLSLPH